MSKVLITGTSSGLGAALANVFKNNDDEVYSISRRKVGLFTEHVDCDLADPYDIEYAIGDITYGVDCFDYVFLNAGILGTLDLSINIPTHEYQKIFNIHVWANKTIVDFLIRHDQAENVIAISSGAANHTYYGWSPYCTSKAALKQLMSCYADEHKHMTFKSFSPGPIDTRMQTLIADHDEKDIPSVSKFKDLNLQSAHTCAQKIFDNLDAILKYEDHFLDFKLLFCKGLDYTS